MTLSTSPELHYVAPCQTSFITIARLWMLCPGTQMAIHSAVIILLWYEWSVFSKGLCHYYGTKYQNASLPELMAQLVKGSLTAK